MAKGSVLQPLFKVCHQRQTMLLLPSLDELIAKNHPVKMIDKALSKNRFSPGKSI